MASILSILRRRSVLSLSSIIFNRHTPSLSSFSPAHLSRSSFPKPKPSLFVPIAFQSTNASVARVYENDEEMKIGPEKLLAEGCDYNHWLVTMDFPDDPRPSPQEMVEAYVETAARVLGSVEEAKKKIYACSTTTYTGFQVEVSEEVAKMFQGLPDVAFVVPDSYIDPVNKQYGGDKYDNGIITHRRPPEQDGRQEEQAGDQNTDFNRRSHPRDEYQQRNQVDDEGTTQLTEENLKAHQNSTSQQNYGPPRVAPVNNSARGQENYQGQFSKKNNQGQMRDRMLLNQRTYIQSQRGDSYPQGQSMPSEQFNNNAPQQGVKSQGAGGKENYQGRMRDRMIHNQGSYIQSKRVDSYPQGPSMPSGEFNNNAPQQGVKWQGAGGQVNYQGQIRDRMLPPGGSYIQSQRRDSYPQGQSMPSGEFDNNTPQQGVKWQGAGGQVNHQEQMRDQMLPTGGSYIQSKRVDSYPHGPSMPSGEFNNNAPQQGVKWQGTGGQVNYQGQIRDRMLPTGGSYIQSQRRDSYPQGQSMPSGEFDNNTPQQGVKWQGAGGQVNHQEQMRDQMLPTGGSDIQSKRVDSYPQGPSMPSGEFNSNAPQQGVNWQGAGGQVNYQGQMRDQMLPTGGSYIQSQRRDSYPQGQSMPLGEFNNHAPQQGVKWQGAVGQVNYQGQMKDPMLPNQGSNIQSQRGDSYPQGQCMPSGEFNYNAPQQGVKWQGAGGRVNDQGQMKDQMFPNQRSYIQSQRGDSYPQGQSMPLGEFNNNAPQQGFNWQGAGGSYGVGASGNYWQGTVGSYGQGAGGSYWQGAGGKVGGGSYGQGVGGSGQGLIQIMDKVPVAIMDMYLVVILGQVQRAGINYGQGVVSNYGQGTTGIYEQGASGIYGQGASGSYGQGGGGGYWQDAGGQGGGVSYGQGGGVSYGQGGGVSYGQALRGAGLGVINNHGQGSGGSNGHVPGGNIVAAACSNYGQGVGSNYGQGTTGSYEQGAFGSYGQGATGSYEQDTGGVVPGQEQFPNYGHNNFVHRGGQRFSQGEWMNDLQQVQQ